MSSRKPFVILSLVLTAMQSSGEQAHKQAILDGQQLGTQGLGTILSADGSGPLIPGGDAPFETAKEQERDFARQFNGLIVALREFSATYNSGHVIDVKKVKAVRKAWVELEKSGWFRPENTK